MRLHETFEATCRCGKTHSIDKDGTVFTCSCGRKSVVDFSLSYTVDELVALLDDLDRKRDKIVWLIDRRRQRSIA